MQLYLAMSSYCYFSYIWHIWAYITKDNVDFGHLYVPSPTFSEIFKILNKVFDSHYSRLRSEAFILDKLFSYISSSIEKIYPKWFNHDEYAVHRKDLVYFVLKVKIHKDTVWLSENHHKKW